MSGARGLACGHLGSRDMLGKVQKSTEVVEDDNVEVSVPIRKSF